jgi:hypothetical protein
MLNKKLAALPRLPGSSYFLGESVASSATDIFPPSAPSDASSSPLLCKIMVILIATTRRGEYNTTINIKWNNK